MKKILLALFIGCLSVSYSQTDYSSIYDTESILSKGIDFHDSQKYEEAIKEYEKISIVDPRYLEAQYEKVLSLSASEKKEELKTFLEDLYSKNRMPEYPALYTLYGSYLSDQKEYEKAENIFLEGQKYLPNSSSFLYNFALLYVRKEESQKAVDLLEYIITNDPNHSSSHYLLGAIALDNGKITEATLAMMSYLIIAPTGQYALNAIQSLNAKFGENYLEKNKVIFSKSGDNFSDIEVILRNQLALRPAYKVQSELDDVIIRQIQAVAEYSLEHKMGDGFFETTYIPWVKDMMEQKRFEAYSYYILMGMTGKIEKKLNSKKKLITDFYSSYVLGSFWNAFAKRKMDIFGTQQEVIVSIKNHVPYLIGSEINGKSEGKYKYLNSSGNLAGELNFKNGELDGVQKYFDEKGNLDEEKSFKNGKLDGKRTLYFPNGNLSIVENYVDGVREGLSTSYYINGGKQCEVNFKNGEREGNLTCLYANGSKKTESVYANGKLEGLYTSYNVAGDVVMTYNCVNDYIDGKYVEYYDGKALKTEANYSNGSIKDIYKTYYKNNVIEQERSYEAAKIKKVIDYFANGKKSGESTYSDKEELENYSYYDSNDNKYFEEKYKSGEIKSYVQYSKNAKPVETTITNKAYVLNDYDGNQFAIGHFEKGEKIGEWNHHFSSGNKRMQEFYTKGGIQNGLDYDYNKNGIISSIKNYKNDSICGLYEVYENGKLDRSYSYNNDKQFGPHKTFYTDGTLRSIGFFVDGENYYDKLYYRQNGSLAVKETYFGDVLTSSQSYSINGEKEEKIDFKNKTATITQKSGAAITTSEYVNGELNGKLVTKDKSNNLIKEVQLVNGVMHGSYKKYGPTGNLFRDFNLYAGNINGVDKIYDLVGNLRYIDNNNFGVNNGKTTFFYHNKMKMKEFTEVDDYIEGDCTYFNQKGEPILIIAYLDNKIIHYIKKSKTGELNEKVLINNQTAEITSSYPNGKTAIQMNFVKGNFEGKFTINNELGKPEYSSTSTQNLLDGERIEYYANGTIYKKERFKNGNNEGLQEYFTETGKPWLTAEYKNDELHGNVLIYKEGKLISTKKYDSDELVEIIK